MDAAVSGSTPLWFWDIDLETLPLWYGLWTIPPEWPENAAPTLQAFLQKYYPHYQVGDDMKLDYFGYVHLIRDGKTVRKDHCADLSVHRLAA
jgi:hypothetical protein